jgi:hypothetical protein
VQTHITLKRLVSPAYQLPPQSLIESFFWQTYQDCARDPADPKHTNLSDLVQLVKQDPAPTAQVLYRLSYAIFSYAIIKEPSQLQQAVEQCCKELESLQADYSLLQIGKYLSKYMSPQFSVVNSN